LEDEHVLLPLSNFEITGLRRDEEYPCLNVLEISLNINLNAQKLEGMGFNCFAHTLQTQGCCKCA